MNTVNQSAEKIEALLLELLEPLRCNDDTLLYFEIDCRTLAEPIWENFVASLSRTELRELKNWPIIEKTLSTLVRKTLARGNSFTEASETDSKPIQNTDKSPPQSLGIWLERLVEMMQGIDQRALQILALRLESFENRDISEQLETGLRCVQQISQEMKIAWNSPAPQTT